MSRVFVSYSRADEDFAHRLAADLSNAGADVWIDVDDIPAGMKWSTAIQEGLDTCNVMIVIISPDSMQSRNVEDEWQSYLDDRKPVIPVLWKPTRVHFQLRRIQYVNFHDQDYDTAFRQLHSEVRRKGIRLDPLDEEDSSVAIPVQTPLPSYDDEADASPPPSHYQHPPYTPPDSQPPFTPPAQAPAYAAPVPQGQQSLYEYAVNVFRTKNWDVTSYTPETTWLEGWSYGPEDKHRQMTYLIYGVPVLFAVVGGVIAGAIAAQSYRQYRVSLSKQDDDTVVITGDLGQYTLSSPQEVMQMLNVVKIDANSFNGLAPWVIPIAVGLVVSCICFLIYSASLAGSTTTY